MAACSTLRVMPVTQVTSGQAPEIAPPLSALVKNGDYVNLTLQDGTDVWLTVLSVSDDQVAGEVKGEETPRHLDRSEIKAVGKYERSVSRTWLLIGIFAAALSGIAFFTHGAGAL